MEDRQIVELYWERSEQAIAESKTKYGGYCYTVAHNILQDQEDAKECTNDTWMDAWKAMPPHRPSVLGTFLGKITRRIAIDRWRKSHAEKRGGGVMPLVLDELSECVSAGNTVEEQIEQAEMRLVMERFLSALPKTERQIFLRRYWFMDAVKTIAAQFHFSESKVTSQLYRTREKLRSLLKEEGYL